MPTSDPIEVRAERAVNYLAETDEPAARAKALYEGLDRQTKTFEGQAFLASTGSTVAEREANARVNQTYQAHLKEVANAQIDWEIYRNRRNTAEMLIEYWRSLNANRRQG